LVNKLKKVLSESPDIFNDIVYPMRDELDSRILSIKKELTEFKSRLDQFTDEDAQSHFGIDHYTELQYDLMATECEFEYLSQRNFVLREMQILYAYKNVELTLKRIISLAYPDTNMRNLYNWNALNAIAYNAIADIAIADIHQLK
jgi:hypothetical protein